MVQQRTRGTRGRREDGFLVASAAALVLVALLVLQPLVGIGLFTRTVTTYNATYAQVADAYASHLENLNDRNVSALGIGYESNATVKWIGSTSNPMTGTYSGRADIDRLWGSFIGKSINLSVSQLSQSIAASNKGSGYVFVNSTLDWEDFFPDGFSAQGAQMTCGPVNGSVTAQDVYQHVNSSWFITSEIWNFTQIKEPFVDCF